jgi:hypothetical protein
MDDPPGGALLDCQAWHFHREEADRPNSRIVVMRTA